MQLGIDDLDIGVGNDIVSSDFARTDGIDHDLFRLITVKFAAQFLQVQDDLRNVFLYALDGRELMKNTVDLNGSNSDTGKA